MIVVWGSIEARADELEAVKQLSLEHVHRSRGEEGCISHSVQLDLENPNCLVFFEEWRDMPALQAHFQLEASVSFVERVSALAVGPPSMKIFESAQLG